MMHSCFHMKNMTIVESQCIRIKSLLLLFFKYKFDDIVWRGLIDNVNLLLTGRSRLSILPENWQVHILAFWQIVLLLKNYGVLSKLPKVSNLLFQLQLQVWLYLPIQSSWQEWYVKLCLWYKRNNNCIYSFQNLNLVLVRLCPPHHYWAFVQHSILLLQQ